jgi:hypothetical protein
MDYHAKKRIENGVMQFLAYGYAFRDIEGKWPILKNKFIMLGFH